MKLKEMLTENGVITAFDEMRLGADNVLANLTDETDAQYAGYRWFRSTYKTSPIVHAIPPEDKLNAGYPWEEWYRDDDLGEFQHHILYLEKTDKCDMTFDCPADDTTHPEPTRNRFWYLYNDADGRLFYAR